MQKTLSVINLSAIRNNAVKIKKILGRRFFWAVVKADAYGHGAEEVARSINDIADGFCVAIVEEGIKLRVAGIEKPVLVLTPPLDGYDAARAAAYGLIVTVNSFATAKLCKEIPCHIKVNTGMNRVGCNAADLPAILNVLKKENVLGVYSHLYAAQSDRASLRQLALFNQAVRIVKYKNPEIYAHISASGGILRGGKFLMDGARAGILLYGYAPEGFRAEGFLPALKVYARKIQNTKFIGGGIGYNFADKNYKTVSAFRLGYADGFSRTVPLGEKTLCMDSFIAEKGGALECVFDNAEIYAARRGTISYETLTSVTRRSERIYER